jgi:hypothetical protein
VIVVKSSEFGLSPYFCAEYKEECLMPSCHLNGSTLLTQGVKQKGSRGGPRALRRVGQVTEAPSAGRI